MDEGMGGWINRRMDRCPYEDSVEGRGEKKATKEILPGAGGEQRVPVAAVTALMRLEGFRWGASQTKGA